MKARFLGMTVARVPGEHRSRSRPPARAQPGGVPDARDSFPDVLLLAETGRDDFVASMRSLRVLHVEDVEEDVLLVQRHLRGSGWSVEWTRVDTAEGLRDALRSPWDVVLSDFDMPGFSVLQALEIVRASERAGTPFIVVSGSVGEQAAIEVLLRGADDFVNKGNLARLVRAIERELDDAQVRAEKKEVQRALAEALSSREELIAVAGHEFRNPLAAMQITIDSLLRTGTAPEHAQALRRQVGRLRDLVTRFIDIAALDAGSFELRTSDVDLGRIVAREVRRRAAEPGRVQLDSAEAVPVHADRGRLELVVASLLDNALKFGGTDPVEIRVLRDGDGGVLEVADHGPGLEEEERETVFRPFGKRVSSRHYGGFGLSLWLSRSILERHGGSIVALPNPGGGALFRVRLPLRSLSRSAPGSSPAGPQPPPASG
jgi:signal transduction histidine kinase